MMKKTSKTVRKLALKKTDVRALQSRLTEDQLQAVAGAAAISTIRGDAVMTCVDF